MPIKRGAAGGGEPQDTEGQAFRRSVGAGEDETDTEGQSFRRSVDTGENESDDTEGNAASARH